MINESRDPATVRSTDFPFSERRGYTNAARCSLVGEATADSSLDDESS